MEHHPYQLCSHCSSICSSCLGGHTSVCPDCGKSKATENFLETKEWGNKWTSIGPALYLARKSLENEETKERIIVLISDGDADFCPYDDPFDKCPPEAKRNLIAHSQEKEADEIYKRKIRVIFALVGTLYKGSDAAIARVNHIAKSPENIVPVASFTSFDTSVLDNMIYTICKEQH